MNAPCSKIGTLLVEDDLPVRQLISSTLKTFPNIDIIGESSDGQAALDLIYSVKPAAVFLDIEIPGLSGLLLAAQAKKINPRLAIVFISGHSGYAAEAFQLEALDYLVKPIGKESLQRAINRIIRFNEAYNNLVFAPADQRIALKFNHEIQMVNIDDIIYIEKVGRYSLFHTTRGDYRSTDTLNSISDKLGSSFFRCHRSFIINTGKIEKIVPIADRIYKITFQSCNSQVTMGREQYEQLCKKILAISD